ncbi:MAG: radical SAM protein, partial [Candidatus Omnitrophica bacterium]|nr:radical SAM protein [Candidatus Omnitrophota bacterium]
DEIIRYLKRFPPHSIQITLNGVTARTYESITQVEGSFMPAMRIIRRLAKHKFPLLLKAVCLKQNQHEIGRIKEFSEELLGKPKNHKYSFLYDGIILPRLNGDKTPLNYRLSFEELSEVRRQDRDIWEEYQESITACSLPARNRKNALFQCNSWENEFTIDPYGYLRFCGFSRKYKLDVKTIPFRKGFYRLIDMIRRLTFRTRSPCKECRLREYCYYCPVRAFLETGNEEGPVEYYCNLALKTRAMEKTLMATRKEKR